MFDAIDSESHRLDSLKRSSASQTRAVPYNRGTSSIFKFESFTESSLGYYKRGPTAFY